MNLVSKLATSTIIALVAGGLITSVRSQAPATKPRVPQWQIDAGGTAKFDIASIKQNNSDSQSHSNIPLESEDTITPTGGLFSATNVELLYYITFAYKLTDHEYGALRSKYPKWVKDRYDIQARASGNPTKDQFRLMMQSLLAERFKLAVHWETQQLPVMALVLDKPGRLGPHLQAHPENAPCSPAVGKYLPPEPPPPPTVAGGFPLACGAFQGWDEPQRGRWHAGGRNITIQMIGDELTQWGSGIDRPLLDRTGLQGKYDFVIEFSPQLHGPLPPGYPQPDPTGPTFLEALKEQLGLKLEPKTGDVDILIIDHIEEPTPN